MLNIDGRTKKEPPNPLELGRWWRGEMGRRHERKRQARVYAPLDDHLTIRAPPRSGDVPSQPSFWSSGDRVVTVGVIRPLAMSRSLMMEHSVAV